MASSFYSRHIYFKLHLLTVNTKNNKISCSTVMVYGGVNGKKSFIFYEKIKEKEVKISQYKNFNPNDVIFVTIL